MGEPLVIPRTASNHYADFLAARKKNNKRKLGKSNPKSVIDVLNRRIML